MVKKVISLLLASVIPITSMGVPVSANDSKEVIKIEKEVSTLQASEDERKISFNNDWKFILDEQNGAAEVNYDDSAWRNLTLPHDWSIEFDFNKDSPASYEGGFLDGGIGWYRKTFVLPESMNNKEINIDFDGVYMDSTVYVNGTAVGNRPYGYVSFSYDIADLLYKDGRENVIAVRVNNRQPSSRWYSGSGIYRNVWLTVTEGVNVDRYGTYAYVENFATVHDENRDYTEDANVNVETTVNNDTDTAKEASVVTSFYNPSGKKVASETQEPITIEANASHTFKDVVKVKNPDLWGVETPNLYNIVTEVKVGEEVVDTYETDFGIRYTTFTPDNGFYLNGEYMKLNGVCMHHDLGALGAAVNYRAIERQMQMMKDMGVNAIRITHNPPSPEIIEICNKLGLMTIVETFDGWAQSKKAYDYGRFFNTWAERDVKDILGMYKNDPSVIMWSLGNEVWDNGASGLNTAKNLNKWAKEVDTTRPTTIGEDRLRNPSQFENSTVPAINDVFDIVGYNYGEDNFDYTKEVARPNWTVMTSESASAVRSRGIYAHPKEFKKSHMHEDLQQSSYDNDSVSWGRFAEESWKYNRDREFVLGEFVWTGFDYIGEPTPYFTNGYFPAKSSYFGAVDTAGFEKDAFYYYQSQWSDKDVLHLLPHWNWENDDSIKIDGDKINVWAYTNAEEVELFLNGESVGKKSYEKKVTDYGMEYLEREDGKTYLEWDVPYVPGTLEAVGYKNGVEVSRDIIKTASEPAALKVSADRQVIDADGKDLSFITIDVVDKDGNIVPTASNLINFEVVGDGELVGVDNGNAATTERYKDNKRSAFSGKALGILQSKDNAGVITLKVTSPGLEPAVINVFTTEEGVDEKEIIGFDAMEISLSKGDKTPELPNKINAVLGNGDKKEVKVKWDEISEEDLNKAGTFKVYGKVKGTDIAPYITIIVKDIVAIRDYTTATSIGVKPQLPSEIDVIYTDGSSVKSNVTWEEISNEQLSKVGTFEVLGNVQNINTDIKAKAIIRVTDDVSKINIASKDLGAKAFASYINPSDPVETVNDGIVSYGQGASKNRWANWQPAPYRTEDHVGINFGDEKNVNNMEVYFYSENEGCLVPERVSVEYLNADGTWMEVSNIKVSEIASNDAENPTKITFDAVKTSQIRVNMYHSGGGTYSCMGLTEIKIYSNEPAISNDATLSSIKVDGKEIEGLEATKFNYNVNLPYSKNIPVIEAINTNNASVMVIPPTKLPGQGKIEVVAENGVTKNIYTIAITMEEPKLSEVILSADNTNITQDDIVPLNIKGILESGEEITSVDMQKVYSYSDENLVSVIENSLYAYEPGVVTINVVANYKGNEVKSNDLKFEIAKNNVEKNIVSFDGVEVLTDKGQEPKLPEKVKANYDVGLSKMVNVVWDNISEEYYADYGSFGVSGNVENTDIKAKATVTVKGIVAADTISLTTLIGEIPELQDRVEMHYSDGTSETVDVVWDEISQEQVNTIGEFTVNGDIGRGEVKAKASVRVTDKYFAERNIALTQNGFVYPKAQGSFEPSGNDSIDSVNNGTISYNSNPHDRWTNWSGTNNEDWVSITFGSSDPIAFYVDSMDIYYYTDHGSAVPATSKIQYWNGTDWVDVSGQEMSANPPVSNGLTTYTFDKVKTERLRVVMTREEGKCIGITEMKVMRKEPIKNNEAQLTNIKLNNEPLKDFNEEKLEYNLTLKAGETFPEVTAETDNNSAITIIPATNVTKATTIIVKSEDATISKTYKINFKLEEIIGDFNKNGKIDIGDLSIVSKNYGQNNPKYDINKDGIVDNYEINYITAKILE
ncbi:MAG: Ig-like domain-containing protein [Clostridium sp.]